MLFETIRADAVTERCLGVRADIPLHLIPGPILVSDLLAVAADGEQSFQRSHRFLQPVLLP